MSSDRETRARRRQAIVEILAEDRQVSEQAGKGATRQDGLKYL